MDPIPLSPVDYLFVGPGSQPITFAFAYPIPLDGRKLQVGLEKTLQEFPLLRSKITRITETDLVFSFDGGGIVLEMREAAEEFDAARGTSPYISPVHSSEGASLAAFTLTLTPSGAVLAASVSHALADGFSYFHFLASWARICRGDRILPPSLDRSYFATVPSGALPSTSHEDLLRDCGLFVGDRRIDPVEGPVDRQRVTRRELNEIADEARRTTGTSLTENDVLVALLWKRRLAGPGEEKTSVTCPVDFRRLVHGFPRSYFGCALAFATSVAPASAVARMAVGDLAAVVKETTGAIRSDRVAGMLRDLDRYRREHGLLQMECVHLRQPSNGLIVTNLTRMPIGDIDFGYGPPVGFVPHVQIAGGAALAPADDGIEIITGK